MYLRASEYSEDMSRFLSHELLNVYNMQGTKSMDVWCVGFQAVGGLSSEAKVEVFTALRRSVPKAQNDTLKLWEAKARAEPGFTRFHSGKGGWMVGLETFLSGK